MHRSPRLPRPFEPGFPQGGVPRNDFFSFVSALSVNSAVRKNKANAGLRPEILNSKS
jgi:hypothetical protein